MISNYDLNCAKLLRALRLKHDLKQSSVAVMIGVSSQQIYSQLETGKVRFTERTIQNICRAFDIKAGEFKGVELPDAKQNTHESKQVDTSATNAFTLNTIITAQKESINAFKLLLAHSEKLNAEKEAHITALEDKLKHYTGIAGAD